MKERLTSQAIVFLWERTLTRCPPVNTSMQILQARGCAQWHHARQRLEQHLGQRMPGSSESDTCLPCFLTLWLLEVQLQLGATSPTAMLFKNFRNCTFCSQFIGSRKFLFVIISFASDESEKLQRNETMGSSRQHSLHRTHLKFPDTVSSTQPFGKRTLKNTCISFAHGTLAACGRPTVNDQTPWAELNHEPSECYRGAPKKLQDSLGLALTAS